MYLRTLVFLFTVAACTTSDAAGTSFRIAPDTVPHSIKSSDADLAVAWWRWAAAFDAEHNPVVDATGEDCARGQSGDVWFLAGSFGEVLSRSCRIPANQHLFFPVINCFGDGTCSAQVLGDAKGLAVLDGAPLETVSPPPTRFSLVGVAGNPLTQTERAYQLVTEGQWVRLAPLALGKHTLRIQAKSSAFSLDVTYALEIEGASGK